MYIEREICDNLYNEGKHRSHIIWDNRPDEQESIFIQCCWFPNGLLASLGGSLHPPRCQYNVRMSGIFGSLAQKSNKCWFSSQLSLDMWNMDMDMPYSAFYEILEIWFVYMHFVATQSVLTDDDGFACICKLKFSGIDVPENPNVTLTPQRHYTWIIMTHVRFSKSLPNFLILWGLCAIKHFKRKLEEPVKESKRSVSTVCKSIFDLFPSYVTLSWLALSRWCESVLFDFFHSVEVLNKYWLD